MAVQYNSILHTITYKQLLQTQNYEEMAYSLQIDILEHSRASRRLICISCPIGKTKPVWVCPSVTQDD